ncbi:hypothetical protein [Methanobacterium sp. ACI-7]|uniref:hypothetical protein n=1 Tax=unclassified Methanobacterium TaxID=2627676 RepID=UPI0039C1BA97
MESLNYNNERRILNPIDIENRIVYPVVDIVSTIDYNNQYGLVDISPVALIVHENENRYIINLSCNELDENELFKLMDLENIF